MAAGDAATVAKAAALVESRKSVVAACDDVILCLTQSLEAKAE
jgi:hypothetical protein